MNIPILAALGIAGVALSAPVAQAGGNVAVVELYTSQGCKSCPPADDVLAQLSGRDDVIALSLHVDYWDYLGWRDTFAKNQFTQRQAAYRDAWRKSVVYTPQMVVQGRHDVMGSRADDLAAAIDAALRIEPPVKVTIERHGGMLKCRIEPGPERTVGIVGCGHVGKDLGRLLRAFGCKVLANDILDFPDFYAESGVEPVTSHLHRALAGHPGQNASARAKRVASEVTERVPVGHRESRVVA